MMAAETRAVFQSGVQDGQNSSSSADVCLMLLLAYIEGVSSDCGPIATSLFVSNKSGTIT
jgi:hypothetical protein